MTAEHRRPRRVGILTTGRHDWGYLAPVARAAAAHTALEPTIFCTGAHLHPAFGATVEAVRTAGLPTVEIPLFSPRAAPEALEIRPAHLAAMAGRLAEAMAARAPEVMVVLGDRIETLTAAVMVAADGRFLAHIHGGDRAAGELDDANRHAITKLAHVHFPATAAAAARIARMGEPADRIHRVGSPGIDSILADGLASSAEARRAAGLPAEGAFVVVLKHPSGLGPAGEAAAAEAIGQAVADAGLTAVLLGPNPDVGGDAIRGVWRKFSRRFNWPITASVDRRFFCRLMRDATALVGDSSSGMVESAAVDAVVIDVGDRQRGREHSANVIHVPAQREAIAEALERVRTDPGLEASLRAAPCVFGDGRAAGRIAEVLAGMDMSNERRIKLNEY